MDDVPAPEAGSNRDWSELPLDALSSVFGKLGANEILLGAGLVCRCWLEAAKLPELWRSVDMANHKVVEEVVEESKINSDALRAMAKVAVDRSGGQLELFLGNLFVTDELLKYIGDRYLSLFYRKLINISPIIFQCSYHEWKTNLTTSPFTGRQL